ncbi:MAG: hypothetical protein ACKPE3_16690 [Sphaerospermopsis kisseleviana]
MLLEVITYCQYQMKIEYPININNLLKGNLDYLLRSHQSLLVIEAKNDDFRTYASVTLKICCRVRQTA